MDGVGVYPVRGEATHESVEVAVVKDVVHVFIETLDYLCVLVAEMLIHFLVEHFVDVAQIFGNHEVEFD